MLSKMPQISEGSLIIICWWSKTMKGGEKNEGGEQKENALPSTGWNRYC